MINKITYIKSISRFKKHSSENDSIRLEKATMLYAPNGRGKTTLSSIMQSFANNNPELIEMRKSKVYTGEPEATIKFNASETAVFKDGNWNKTLPNLSVLTYDRSFIYQNIHTENFAHGHKKNLYKLLAIGDEALEARNKVIELKTTKDDATKDFTAHKNKFSLLGISSETMIDNFVKQEELDDTRLEAIKTEKEAVAKQLLALNAIDKIKQQSILANLNVDLLDSEQLKLACYKTVSGGSVKEIELIKEHMKNMNLDKSHNKKLLELGVGAIGSSKDKCALCGQDITTQQSKDLINALFNVFNDNYTSLQKTISEALKQVEKFDANYLSENIINQSTVNEERLKGWAELIKDIGTVESIATTKADIVAYGVALDKVVEDLKKKKTDPSILINNDAVIEKHSRVKSSLAKYNERINVINENIIRYKDSLDTKNLSTLKQKLSVISDKIIRNSDVGKEYVNEYVALSKKARTSETEYKSAMSTYKSTQKAILDKHTTEMNAFLSYCGAKFTIGNIEQGSGNSQEPFVKYSIKLIEGEQDDEIGADIATGRILSDGERNLLALAFFWSLIKHSVLANTIVILDDPIGGVDESWQKTVIDKIKTLLDEGVYQIFIMTHSKEFAQLVANDISGIKQITITDEGRANGCKITAYDVDADMKYQQFKNIDRLTSFIENPTTALPTDIQALIRIVLENAVKHKYYKKLSHLLPNKPWLRNLIDHSEVKPLLEANNSYADLNTLCVKAGYGNHDNPLPTAFNQSDAENYATLTLSVIERI